MSLHAYPLRSNPHDGGKQGGAYLVSSSFNHLAISELSWPAE